MVAMQCDATSDCAALGRKRRSMNQSKYKTRLCRNFSRGLFCPFGERCAFSHGDPDADADADAADDAPPPPPYSGPGPGDSGPPPAYTQRFRHDPYMGCVVNVP